MSVDTKSSSKWKEIIQRIEFFLNVINQMCIGFVTIYVSWLYLRTGLAGKGLHAWLVSTGFSFLMAEGIMCHYQHNCLTFSYCRKTKTILHWVLQVLGGGMGIAGALVQLIRDRFDFFNTHAKLGFAAFIFCCFSLLSGLSSLFSSSLRNFLSPLLNKTLHNILGLTTFSLALCAQFYGYDTHIFKNHVPSWDFVILMKCLTLISLVLTCVGPLKALYLKISNIISSYYF